VGRALCTAVCREAQGVLLDEGRDWRRRGRKDSCVPPLSQTEATRPPPPVIARAWSITVTLGGQTEASESPSLESRRSICSQWTRF
jgi:hypothetical protein